MQKVVRKQPRYAPVAVTEWMNFQKLSNDKSCQLKNCPCLVRFRDTGTDETVSPLSECRYFI